MLNVECGTLGTASSERANQAVILSEAKDHLATLDQFKKILRASLRMTCPFEPSAS